MGIVVVDLAYKIIVIYLLNKSSIAMDIEILIESNLDMDQKSKAPLSRTLYQRDAQIFFKVLPHSGGGGVPFLPIHTQTAL